MLSFQQAFSKSALLLTRNIKDSASNFEHGIDNLTEKFEVHPCLLLQICKGAVKGLTGSCFTSFLILIFMRRFLAVFQLAVKSVEQHVSGVELWGLYYMERANNPIHLNGRCWDAILAYGITDLFKPINWTVITT